MAVAVVRASEIVYVDEPVQLERTAAHPLGAGVAYLHQNARADVCAVTDASGAVVERRFYDDFGRGYDAAKQPVAGSSVGNPYGFQGRRLDPETGLYYFRARYYSPETGRFLQRDPIWDAGNVGGQYTFVGNGPVSRQDPLGLSARKLVIRIVVQAVTAAGERTRRVIATYKGNQSGALEWVLGSKNKIFARNRDLLPGTALEVEHSDPSVAAARAKKLAKDLSCDDSIRGPEGGGGFPEHVHPGSGEFSHLHVQTKAAAEEAGFLDLAAGFLASTAMKASENSESSVADVVRSGAWDVAKAIDPAFITDVIEDSLDYYSGAKTPGAITPPTVESVVEQVLTDPITRGIDQGVEAMWWVIDQIRK